jgi:hypothetical protein
MQLAIDNHVVAEWKNVRGNPFLRIFDQYVYELPNSVKPDEIKVKFVNDCYTGTEDRNLKVDKIVLNGKTYQTEAASTYSKGAWTQGHGCSPGYRQSEQLSCEGYFQYMDRP